MPPAVRDRVYVSDGGGPCVHSRRRWSDAETTKTHRRGSSPRPVRRHRCHRLLLLPLVSTTIVVFARRFRPPWPLRLAVADCSSSSARGFGGGWCWGGGRLRRRFLLLRRLHAGLPPVRVFDVRGCVGWMAVGWVVRAQQLQHKQQ